MADLYTRLRSVRIRNFRSFRDEQTLKLPSTGLYLVRGDNQDTDGSSGSGKTSLVKAISYVGGYEPVPASKLKCWAADGPMLVEAEYQNERGVAVVKRGTKLQVGVNGEPIKGDAKTVDAGLREFLGGLPEDVLSAVTNRAQKKPGLFLSRPNSEKKAFLSVLLGLGDFEAAAEVATKRGNDFHVQAQSAEATVLHNEAALAELGGFSYPIVDVSALTSKLDVAETEAKTVAAELRQCEERLATMRLVLKSALQKAETDTAAAVQVVEKERAHARATRMAFVSTDSTVRETAARLNAVDAKIQALGQEERAAHQAALKESSALERSLAAIEAKQRDLARIEREQESKAHEIRKIRDDAVCPTCERAWEHGPAKAALQKLDEEFRANERLITTIQIEAAKAPDMRVLLGQLKLTPRDDPRLEKLADERARLQQELGAARAQTQSARAEYDAKVREEESVFDRRLLTIRSASPHATLNAQAAPVIEAQEQTVVRLRAGRDRVASAVAATRDELQRASAKNQVSAALEAQRLDDVARCTGDVEKSRAALVKIVGDEAAELDFALMCKSFLTSIFNEVLAEIATESNAVLARVPNVAHITLQFQEKATGRGPQIETLVFINGHEKGLDDLSGGMETAVDLAVDLAVGTVVARRTGGRMPGWLVLDEPFTGLDSVCKEACMDILKEAAKHRLVLVVDHATEFKEMFSQFVTISYRNGTSRIAEAS